MYLFNEEKQILKEHSIVCITLETIFRENNRSGAFVFIKRVNLKIDQRVN